VLHVSFLLQCDGRSHHLTVEGTTGEHRHRKRLSSSDPISLTGEGTTFETTCEPRGPRMHTSVHVALDAIAISVSPQHDTLTLHTPTGYIVLSVHSNASFWQVASFLRKHLPPRLIEPATG